MWLPSGLSGTHFNINNLPGKGILSRPPGAAGIIINSGFVSQGEVPLCKARALDQESEVLGPCLGLAHGTANPTEWLQADPLHIPRPLSSLQSAQARKLCEHFPLPSRASCCAHCSVVSDSLPPHDCSSPGPSVHGILQARIWSGLPFPSPGDLPGPGIKPSSPALTGGSFTTSASPDSQHSASQAGRRLLEVRFPHTRAHPPHTAERSPLPGVTVDR